MVAVLILQFAIGLAAVTFVGLSLIPFIVYAAAFFLMATLLFPIKQLLKNNTKLQQKATELRKWKTDVNVFKALSANERTVDTSIWENDLFLGNPNAPVKITVACNPYCGPCALAHKLLDELLEMYPNEVSVQVRLLCNPDNELDIRSIATKAILQQAAIIKENKKLQQMLSDWFHFMDLEKWSEIWNPIENLIVQTGIEAHNKWNLQSNIRLTPTFFINGIALPIKYNIDDFQKILPDFAICQAE